MCNWTKGFANVGGVGYVAVGGEHNGADAGGVGGIAERSICCVFSSGDVLAKFHRVL
jgi:hypothetical protein